MKIVEKNIRYNEEVDTYYVQFNFADRVPNKLQSFPTLEDARAYRDAVNKEKLDLKIRESVARVRASDRSKIIFDVSHFNIYPFNIFQDADIESVPEELVNVETFEEEIINAKLDKRKRDFILGVYKNEATLESLGSAYNITRERVRQIVCKGVLIIRNAILRYEKSKKEEREAKALEEEREKLISTIRETGKINEDEIRRLFESPVYGYGKKKENLTIDDVDFSVRTYNCLKRSGFNKISELANISGAQLLEIRNLGKKSRDEIYFKLKELGF